MTGARSGYLPVEGAALYYEVRGSGPTLLMIPGGPADADMMAGLAAAMAERYTVVTYDPRNNSRSRLLGEATDWNPAQEADDAAALIDAVGAPAFVFGNSGGAQAGLALVARHPDKVRMLVAHEPPAVNLLTTAAEKRAESENVLKTYRAQGPGAAMQAFMAMAGIEGGPPPSAAPSPEASERVNRMGGNLVRFFEHGLLAISGYVPDIEALRAGTPRIIVGVGETTAGQIAHETALALARRLGVEPLAFPGDHGGFAAQPAAFGQVLERAFA